METIQIRDAKAGLSAVVAAAERGRPTITRHGHASAMVVPIEAGRRLYPLDTPSLAAHLLALPEACVGFGERILALDAAAARLAGQLSDEAVALGRHDPMIQLPQ